MSTVDLTAFPQGLADRLGISLFAGQILASVIFLMLTLLPTIFLSKGKNPLAVLIVGLGSLGFCVAVNWLPYWFLLIVAMIVAFMFAGNVKNWITRG